MHAQDLKSAVFKRKGTPEAVNAKPAALRAPGRTAAIFSSRPATRSASAVQQSARANFISGRKVVSLPPGSRTVPARRRSTRNRIFLELLVSLCPLRPAGPRSQDDRIFPRERPRRDREDENIFVQATCLNARMLRVRVYACASCRAAFVRAAGARTSKRHLRHAVLDTDRRFRLCFRRLSRPRRDRETRRSIERSLHAVRP